MQSGSVVFRMYADAPASNAASINSASSVPDSTMTVRAGLARRARVISPSAALRPSGSSSSATSTSGLCSSISALTHEAVPAAPTTFVPHRASSEPIAAWQNGCGSRSTAVRPVPSSWWFISSLPKSLATGHVHLHVAPDEPVAGAVNYPGRSGRESPSSPVGTRLRRSATRNPRGNAKGRAASAARAKRRNTTEPAAEPPPAPRETQGPAAAAAGSRTPARASAASTSS